MFCPNCGSRFGDDARYCSACGTEMPTAAEPGESRGEAMDPEEPVFVTRCKWIRWGLDPAKKYEWGSSYKGTAVLTRRAFLFSGEVRAPHGNLLGSLVTAQLVKLIGEVSFSLPLVLIKSVEVENKELNLLGWKIRATAISAVYSPREGENVEKKLTFLPEIEGPETVWMDDEVKGLYRPSESAGNWAMMMKHYCRFPG